MKRVYPLTIQSGMSQSESYILMLCEPNSNTQIPIFIGAHEAQGILLAKETVKTRRPMTHELMVHVMNDYGLYLREVTIDKVQEGIFYSTLHMTDGFNEKHFDSRTSDAITLALLCDCPILVADDVLEETSVKMDNPTFSNATANPKEEIERLEKELLACEEREDYERAAEIQKKIEQLKEIK
ncbi:MAG: bifunctional nuclease family protein [Bacteroidales bacterium]|nr:bifunctional nuclease family protein [Bacteroidales bacterium]